MALYAKMPPSNGNGKGKGTQECPPQSPIPNPEEKGERGNTERERERMFRCHLLSLCHIQHILKSFRDAYMRTN